MTDLTDKQVSMRLKSFLEIVQPLPVRYGYSRGVKRGNSFISYQFIGSTFRAAIGNQIVSETLSFIVYVQTKTAEQNMLYSELLKRGTSESFVRFVSEDLRKDVTVEDGWINTVTLSAFNGLNVEKQAYTPEQVRSLLQKIADSYLMVTSIYRDDLEQSFIDRFIVPELEERIYSRAEVIQLKNLYLDKLILETTEY